VDLFSRDEAAAEQIQTAAKNAAHTSMNSASEAMAAVMPMAQRCQRIAKAAIEKTTAQPAVMPNIQRIVYCGMGF
jgi:hypothetical protein